MDGVLGTRSIFVCQVLAIEGDQSWNIVREEYLQSNGEDEDSLTAKRTVDKGTGRIIFRLQEKDNLKIANPLLSRIYNVFPMVGEWVKVIAYDVAENDLCYDYIGPIIPSLINTNTAIGPIGRRNLDSVGNFSETDPIIDFKGKNVDVKQIYPGIQDIAIHGRGNSQILISKINPEFNKPNEYITIRSGTFITQDLDKVPTYNEKESFIKVTIEPDPKIGYEFTKNGVYEENSNFINHIYKPKYDVSAITTPKQTNEIKTRVDIVGEKINIFTYPTNRTDAYSIPYAELLYAYMTNLQTWLINHKHGIDGTTAQDPALKLGTNLSVDNNGFISIPGKGSKLSLTKDIKII